MISLDELLAIGAGGLEARTGLDTIRDGVGFETCRGLAEVLAGRVVVSIGQAVGGSYGISKSAADLLRRRALALALRDLMGLIALYGISAEEIAMTLGKGEGG